MSISTTYFYATQADSSLLASGGVFREPDQFLAAALRNHASVDPQLPGALDLKAPDFTPAAGSPLLAAENAAGPPADGFFNASAQFVGAVGKDNWLAGWTAFPEN